MQHDASNTLFYKRANFVTRLPLRHLYSPLHFWLTEQNGTWRIGLTQFATRMLGEVVDYGFEVQPGAPVEYRQVLGWIEGFKAVSDLVCIVEGTFQCSNPHLSQNPAAIDRDCYGIGWLYEAAGKTEAHCLDVEGYKALLDATINSLVEKKQSAE